ncbi:hypothetical protein [Pelomonas sp. KK5]|uniref:hypothetical protein n=1 Tax=Pelomonas sp. KK5 TaxID=1855730 RepID=UPI00097BC5E5|nr:hypothetical protein [Pelomonas sp. KK5]
MVTSRRETVTPPALVNRLLEAAGEEPVLVGGQALSFWMNHYGIDLPDDLPAVTLDTDFFTPSAADKALVRRLAAAINGTSRFPRPEALTAIVGQVHLDLSDEEFINVDVIFKVFGLSADAILKRVITMKLGKTVRLRVMHPFHVLASRLANLYQLPDKQNDKGAEQLRLGIEVARAYLREQASRHDPKATRLGRSPVQPLVSEIEKLALDDAGRKVAARWGLHVADAIDPMLIPAGPFWERKWPTLRPLMSTAYVEKIVPPLS